MTWRYLTFRLVYVGWKFWFLLLIKFPFHICIEYHGCCSLILHEAPHDIGLLLADTHPQSISLRWCRLKWGISRKILALPILAIRWATIYSNVSMLAYSVVLHCLSSCKWPSNTLSSTLNQRAGDNGPSDSRKAWVLRNCTTQCLCFEAIK